jgi:hypothetical protein
MRTGLSVRDRHLSTCEIFRIEAQHSTVSRTQLPLQKISSRLAAIADNQNQIALFSHTASESETSVSPSSPRDLVKVSVPSS